MKDVQYGPLNVTVRAKETVLLVQDDFFRLLAAESLSQALDMLRDTSYRTEIERMEGDEYAYHEMLADELVDTFNELYALVPDKRILELASLFYAYHNIKIFFKEKYSEAKLDHLLIPVSPHLVDVYRQAVLSGQSNVLSAEYIYSIQQAQADYDDFEDIHKLDIILDRCYYRHLALLAEEIGQEKIIDLVKLWIDLDNISMALRAIKLKRSPNFLQGILSSYGSLDKQNLVNHAKEGKESFVSYLSTSPYYQCLETSMNDVGDVDIERFEQAADNMKTEKFQEAKMISFGPLPVLAYCHAKQTEIKNLRIILSAIENQIDRGKIEEKFRMNYR